MRREGRELKAGGLCAATDAILKTRGQMVMHHTWTDKTHTHGGYIDKYMGVSLKDKTDAPKKKGKHKGTDGNKISLGQICREVGNCRIGIRGDMGDNWKGVCESVCSWTSLIHPILSSHNTCIVFFVFFSAPLLFVPPPGLLELLLGKNLFDSVTWHSIKSFTPTPRSIFDPKKGQFWFSDC